MGLARFAPHRPHHHPPQERRHRLRRVHGPPLLAERRARRLQDDRRRPDVEEDPLRQRQDRRDRPRSRRVGPGHSIRGHVRQGPPALALRARRTRERHLQDDRRRRQAWTRLGGGLPTGRIGRIGLDVFQKNPDILYAVVENGNRRAATPQEAEMDKRRGGEPVQRTAGNEVFRTDDGGKTWRKVNAGYEAALNKAPYSFNQLRLDQNDPETVYITGQSLASTNDGGKTWKGLDWPSDGVMPRAFGDWRVMWIDPLDSEPPHLRLGRRRQHLLRPGQDQPSRLQPAADRMVRRGRRHGGPVQHLRRPPGPRLVEGPVERLGRRYHPHRLGHGRRGRRHVQLHRSDRFALGLQQPRDGHDVALRPEDGRPDRDHAPAPGRQAAAALQLDAADRACRRTTRPSSTPGPRSSSGPSTAATTGRRSAPT